MALTRFQRDLCRLIAANRIEQGESYVAGGSALGTFTDSPRISRDIDLFHDTEEAVAASWEADRELLDANGYRVDIVRERPTFVEATARKEDESVLVQWTSDSAFRFFPLVEHEDFGLTLHPFDLATNKVLALVGRVEARDWFDVIACDKHIQRLGYLVWAACGKDPGFSPPSIIEEARRSSRYTAEEVSALCFEESAPDIAELSRNWRRMLDEAAEIVAALPAEDAGKCVLDRGGKLLSAPPPALAEQRKRGGVFFHTGSIRGSLPRLIERRRD